MHARPRRYKFLIEIHIIWQSLNSKTQALYYIAPGSSNFSCPFFATSSNTAFCINQLSFPSFFLALFA